MKYSKYKVFEKEHSNLLSLYKKSKESIKGQIRNEIRKNGFLEIALKNKNYKLVSAIINMDRKAISEGFFKDSELILNVIKVNKELFEFLLDNGFDVNFIDSLDTNPLYIAIYKNKVDVVKELLKAGADPNMKMKGGYTPLHIAAELGNVDVVRAFLCYRAKGKEIDLDDKTDNLATALYLATYNNHVEVVEALLVAGADPNITWDEGYTPLYIAVERNNVDLVAVLLRYREIRKINLDHKIASQSSALFIAARYNKAGFVKALLKAGANPNITWKYGITPLYSAAEQGFTDVVKALLRYSKSEKIDLDYNTDNKPTALYIASQANRVDIVEALLKAGANPTIAWNGGSTALHVAVRQGNVDVVKAFVLCKEIREIDLDYKICKRTTALYIACSLGKVEIVEMLLNAGVNPNITGKDDCSMPLHIAAEKGYLEVVRMLCSRVRDINQITAAGFTALYLASNNNHVDVVGALLDAGADANITYKTLGSTPLYIAAALCHIDVVKILLLNREIRKIDLNIKANNHFTALYAATLNNRLDIVEALLNAGANPNISDRNKVLPLHLAAYKGDLKMVEILCSKMSDLNQSSSNGCTPLYLAIYNGKLDIVKFLLNKRAETNIVINSGFSSIDIAAMNERGEILELLLEKGATKFNCESPLTLVSIQSLYQKALERKDEKILLYEQFLSECPRPGPLAYSWAGAVFRAGQMLEKEAKEKESPSIF